MDPETPNSNSPNDSPRCQHRTLPAMDRETGEDGRPIRD